MAPSSSLDGLFSRGLVKSYDMQQFEAITTGGPKDVRVRSTNATFILLKPSRIKLNRITPVSFKEPSYLAQIPEVPVGAFLL